MKKIISITAMVIALSACAPSPQKEQKKFHVEAQQVHHFSDGRVGYRDDDGIWWWLILNNQMTSTTTSPTISGGWSKGSAPTQAEIDAAEVETQGVVETADGEPVDATEAAAVAEADPSIADTVATETSGEIDISASAEGTVDAGVDTGSVDTGSVDTGSYDSGGGFDSGGGDAGGGGGE